MENIHLEKVPQVSVYHSSGVCAQSCCHAMKQGADKELKQTTHTGCSDPRLDFQRGERKKKAIAASVKCFLQPFKILCVVSAARLTGTHKTQTRDRDFPSTADLTFTEAQNSHHLHLLLNVMGFFCLGICTAQPVSHDLIV